MAGAQEKNRLQMVAKTTKCLSTIFEASIFETPENVFPKLRKMHHDDFSTSCISPVFPYRRSAVPLTDAWSP
jgi:hypothetical protein